MSWKGERGFLIINIDWGRGIGLGACALPGALFAAALCIGGREDGFGDDFGIGHVFAIGVIGIEGARATPIGRLPPPAPSPTTPPVPRPPPPP
jgi:hypothetical protein